MQIQSLFENRDKTYLNLLKGSVYLGRVLRENVVLFDVDVLNQEAMFLTETENIIKAKYEADSESITLADINVTDVTSFTSEEPFNQIINEKIKHLIEATKESSFTDMHESFNSLLDSFEYRIHLDEVKNKISLKENIAKMDAINKTPFFKLFEVKDLVSKFFKANEKTINGNKELLENIHLASTISDSLSVNTTFTLDELVGTTQVFLKEDLDSPLFDIVCKQEFLKKELYESKNSLYSSWTSAELITELITHIAEEDANDFEDILERTITKYPYFAFLNKKELQELVETHFIVNGESAIAKKDLNKLVKSLFESKKVYKEFLTDALNEKHGIALNTIKETPSLKSLGKLHTNILKELSSLCPPTSILSDVLVECSKEVKAKQGIDLLFVNDMITILLSENNLLKESYLNLGKIKDDLMRIKNVLSSQGGGVSQGEAEEGMPPEQGMEQEEQGREQEEQGTGQGEEQQIAQDDVPDPDAAQEEMEQQEDPSAQGMPPEQGTEQGMEQGTEQGMPPEEGMEQEESPTPGGVDSATTNPEELMHLVKDIEELLTGMPGSDIDTEERDMYDE